MKFNARLTAVQAAQVIGIKPACRKYGLHRDTLRKWLRRYQETPARSALLDHSRRPHHCPHQTPPDLEQLVLQKRAQAPCCGAARLVDQFDLPVGVGAAKRILRQHGKTAKRQRKYQTKRDLRAIKARCAVGENWQLDVKYLTDIPYYYEQLARHPDWPRFEYTLREVKSGGLFLGFARDLSELHATTFVRAAVGHLQRQHWPLPAHPLMQTDNGSEFGGQSPQPDQAGHVPHTLATYAWRHCYIPPGAKNRQADVESFHWLVERELFNLEHYADRATFFAKTTLWQWWFNLVRRCGSKGHRTPDEILRAEHPNRPLAAWLLPTLDLDQLVRQQHLSAPLRDTIPIPYPTHPGGGYHVPALAVRGTIRSAARTRPGAGPAEIGAADPEGRICGLVR